MPRLIPLVAAFTICALAACAPEARSDGPPANQKDLLAETRRLDGFFNLAVSDANARVYALLPAPGDDGVMLRAIHAMRLSSGLGSNPIGLDRGWGDNGRIVRFRRVGNRVFLEAENHRYRASADTPEERRAVAESFARSVLWSGEIKETQGDGRLVVDLSPLLTADLLGLAQRLGGDGGSFSLDADRSAPTTSEALAFPKNVELAAELTFAASDPGGEVRATAAEAGAVTLGVHHSFAELPDAGFEPRVADPRMGVFALGFYDFSAPLEGEVLRSYAWRHRLARQDPDDPESPFVDPIVFYVDPGAPEAIRNALVEGASWWGDAFEAAGLTGAYRVEVLPEDAHPLDIRYNVIQWVHRQTRGWSYGGGVVDPRTGEFIKGHVILGSQRVRQDRKIFEGLAGVQKTGTGEPDDPVVLSLARIRQLAAHEVGHSLGFGHNFAASVNDRASVMDYPAPWVKAADGDLDFSDAYDAGIGRWDVATVHWLYGEYPDETEAADLDAIAAETREQGLLFVKDGHGRSVGSAHPAGAVWDNGVDPIAELRNVADVRRIALDDFSERSLAEGRPLAALADVLPPIYLYHRYQLNAAAKSLGGATYQYGKNGADAAEVTPVPAATQNAALAAILETLTPEFLDLPEAVLAKLEPSGESFWFPTGSEEFETRAAPLFDMTAMVETAADLSFAALLNPRRIERLAAFEARGYRTPTLTDVFDAVEAAVIAPRTSSRREAAIARSVRARYVAALIELEQADLSAPTRALVRARLEALQSLFADDENLASRFFSAERRERPEADKALDALLAAEIAAHLDRLAPAAAPRTKGPETPPGSPIGQREDCWHCDTVLLLRR